MYKYALLIVLIVLLFLSPGLKAQYSNKQIDSLIILESQEYRMDGKWKEGLELYKIILQASKQNNYRKGIAEAYINMGNLYLNMGNSTASILHFDTALVEIRGLKDKVKEARLLSELGKVYNYLNQYDKALQYYDHALVVATQIEKVEQRLTQLQYVYAMQASIYEKTHNISNFYIALNKAYVLAPSPYMASRIARYFLIYNRNLDSARTYIEIANKMWETGTYPLRQKAIMSRNEGLYHFTINNYPRAIELYKESISIFKKMGDKKEEGSTYEMLLELYAKIKNAKEMGDVLQKSELLTDSMDKDKKIAATLPLTDDDGDTQSLPGIEKKQSGFRAGWYIAALLLIIVLMVLLFYYKLRKKRNGEEESV